MSPDWISSKKATRNPKNEKDNECFKWSIIAGLNYNKIKEKELKKLLKLKRVDTDFSSYQRYWENFGKENNSIAINPIQDVGGPKITPSPYQFFPCNFYKRRIWSPNLSDF